MTCMIDQLIDVIAKAPKARSDAEIQAVIPWLRRKVQILRNLDKGDIVQIVQKCHYETAQEDEIIIHQGDRGDRMYIVLRGSTLVYIDASLTGEEEQIMPTPAGSPEGSPDMRRRSKIFEKSQFGKYIMKYEAGTSFGEAALLDDDKSRNATIVAEADCDLLVIGQALFDKVLKDVQEKQYAEISHFVEQHPYFSHMSPKFKRLLQLSLRREIYPFDTNIIKQGDPLTALYFLLTGQCNVYVEPNTYQKQYSHLWPFEAGTDLYSQEFEWLRESRRNAILRKYEDPSVWPTKSEHLIIKRTEGYAAVEKRVQERSVCLCSIRSGEIIGDIELVMKLGTSVSTVTCSSACVAFVLDLKNLERLVGRRNPLTMEIMKDSAKEKLDMRANSKTGKEVPFIKYLMHKINEERLPSAKKLPPIKTAKQLPPKEIQVQHLLEQFKYGRAQLIEPCVPGGLIYKEQMQEKARIRANIRRRDSKDINAMLREARRKMNRRQPRSRREIIESLKDMIESELVEVKEPVPKKTKGTKQKSKTVPPTQKNKKRVSLPDIHQDPSTPRRNSGTLLTAKNVRFSDAPKESSADDKSKSLQLPSIVETREDSSLVSSRELSALHSRETEEEKYSREDARSAVSTASSKMEYHRKEVAATSNSPTRLPPLAKVELRKPESISPTKWDAALNFEDTLRFVNDRINDRFSKQLLQKGTSEYDDYETSELSLTLLESRIKSFFIKHGDQKSYSDVKKDLKLPQLRRYTMDAEDSDVSLPKPGGKVWIKKRLCRFAHNKKKVVDHDHVRYHMVPELPQFDEVKKKRIIMHRFMSGTLSRGSSNSSPNNKNIPSFLEKKHLGEEKISS